MLAVRVGVALGISLAAMGALFWVTQWMIAAEATAPGADRVRPVIEFVRLQRDTETQVKNRQLPEPPPETAPPPQMPSLHADALQPQAVLPDIATSTPQVPLSFGGMFIGPVRQVALDREAMPVSRPPPLYPYNAERKRIEGWVKVSFLVTERGKVAEMVVMEAEPSGVFERAALSAVSKWQFKPRMVEGNPVAARMEQVVHFRLTRK